jgi:hypothetical protein
MFCMACGAGQLREPNGAVSCSRAADRRWHVDQPAALDPVVDLGSALAPGPGPSLEAMGESFGCAKKRLHWDNVKTQVHFAGRLSDSGRNTSPIWSRYINGGRATGIFDMVRPRRQKWRNEKKP